MIVNENRSWLDDNKIYPSREMYEVDRCAAIALVMLWTDEVVLFC